MPNGCIDAHSLTKDFVLIGTPVGHSLSPVMHNAVYAAAGINWRYRAIDCPTTHQAAEEIARVRTGAYKGMNITMPYKKLALSSADVVDSSADVAGGANVLVRHGFDLYAYNTDGMGAVGALERAAGNSMEGAWAAVCGTGPTSNAIAVALIMAGASEVVLFSRDLSRSEQTAERLRMSLGKKLGGRVRAASYDTAWQVIPGRDVVVDATPRGMAAGDEAIVDVNLFRAGQTVLDVVYGHGLTKLVEGARQQGAIAIDGLDMLVEQGAIAIEIWQEALGVSFDVSRDLMRDLALRH